MLENLKLSDLLENYYLEITVYYITQQHLTE